MKKRWLFLLVSVVLGAVFLIGCGNSSTAQVDNDISVVEAAAQVSGNADDSVEAASVESEIVSAAEESVAAVSAESDQKAEVSAASTAINLSDYADHSVVNITAAGEYTLSGTLSDGQVVVTVGSEEEVQLNLDQASITNNSGSALVVENAEKVVINLVDGTENFIADGSSYADLDTDGQLDATIFSHDDLIIKGSGSLTVQANYSDGIESRDDLKIKGGTITVTAVDTGLFGNNSVELESAVLVITSDGDSVHSDGDILMESGSVTLSSGDDGMHADGTLTINDGTINVQQSYEGLEATDVIVNGGTIDIVANDDGINGAGGNDSSGTETAVGGGPRDNFSSSQCSITINGGTITIAAALSGAGDGLDANGTITITGGDMVIKVPSSYRDYSSIDSNSGATMTGGNVQILENGTYTQVTASNIANFGGMAGGGGHRP